MKICCEHMPTPLRNIILRTMNILINIKMLTCLAQCTAHNECLVHIVVVASGWWKEFWRRNIRTVIHVCMVPFNFQLFCIYYIISSLKEP